MFGKKKTENFEDKIKAAKYECIFQSLNDILKVEIKAKNADGNEEPDYAAMCSAIKTKARLALDFVADLDTGGSNEK